MDTCIHLTRSVDASVIQAISAPIIFRAHIKCHEWKG